MPALPKQQIDAEHEDGTTFSAKVDASVTAEGIFSLSIPPELLSIANEVKDKEISVARHNSASSHRVYGKTLAACKQFLNKCAEQLLNATEISERVIVYRTQTDVTVWIGKDGKLYPNGALEEGEGGNWWNPKTQNAITGTNRVKCYSIGLAARVYDKITTTRESGQVVRWEEIDRSDNSADAEIKSLNSFVGFSMNPDGDAYNFKEMLYTPQRAQFFTNMMLGMARLGMNIDAFFSDEQRMLKAVESGSCKLLGI